MRVRQWPDVAQRAIAYAPGLLAYVICALIAGESSLTSWWFFVGVGIYVGAVFVEHRFTSPQDAIANSIASVGIHLAADRAGSQPLWSLYLALVVATLSLALLATLPFENLFKSLAFHWAATFGRVRVLGGFALMIEFAHRVQEQDKDAITFGIGAALLLIVVSGRWYTALGDRTKRSRATLRDAVGPAQLLLDHVPSSVERGDVVTIVEGTHEVDLVVAATSPGGLPADERTLAGPVPHDDREAAYHRNLTGRINARYGEAVKTWADRIVEYVGRRDEHTGELAKYLDRLARTGIDAERVLDLAAARKPLPVDHPTAALGYRVKDLVTPRRQRRAVPSIDPFPRSPQHDSGPSLGM